MAVPSGGGGRGKVRHWFMAARRRPVWARRGAERAQASYLGLFRLKEERGWRATAGMRRRARGRWAVEADVEHRGEGEGLGFGRGEADAVGREGSGCRASGGDARGGVGAVLARSFSVGWSSAGFPGFWPVLYRGVGGEGRRNADDTSCGRAVCRGAEESEGWQRNILGRPTCITTFLSRRDTQQYITVDSKTSSTNSE